MNSNPSRAFAAVTPSDTTDLQPYCKGLYIGGAGNLAICPMGSSTPVTFVGVLPGTVLDVTPSRVFATGTTATNIVALYQ